VVEADAVHPGYGWAQNKGYGARVHTEAIRALGLTPLHRRLFVRKILADKSENQGNHQTFITI